MAVTDKERKLAATLSDPVLWGQAYLYNRDGSGRDYWPHQVEDLTLPGQEHHPPRRPGRGKVHCALDRRAPLRLHHPGWPGPDSGTAPSHLDSIIEEIEYQLDTNPDLMNSVALTKYGKPKIHRKPYFRLEFTNGSVLYFRPAGPMAMRFAPCMWDVSGSMRARG